MPPEELEVVDVYVVENDVVWYDVEETQHTDFKDEFYDSEW